MTNPRLPSGRVDGSQDRGDASPFVADSGYSWAVNFNNGNSNDIHHNNDAFVRLVRSAPAGAGECQGAVQLPDLFDAWKRARRQKKPGRSQLAFEARWIDSLLSLQARLNDDSWQPAPPACFVATRPKAREIHAPAFEDRVVHHWLIQQLERIFEPTFAYDSYANRVGKGTHAAVSRLHDHVRQVQSGQGHGHFLQLDIRNFFYSIPRARLWAILKARMVRCGVPLHVQRITHALLRHSPTSNGVIHLSSAAERALVPMHKRLECAAPGRGLPIGNLSSQFFANVYLDRLDQFIKRRLGVKRYVRYVDDFVIVHQSRQQLEAWKVEIECFLAEQLQLGLKDDVRLAPLSQGIDFLGYIVLPSHLRVRRRVIQHARETLHHWQQRHVHGAVARGTPEDFRHITSVWGSYNGHFERAASHRLGADFHRRFPWLRDVTGVKRRFDCQLEGRQVDIRVETAA